MTAFADRFLYRTYERRLLREISRGPVPDHVGVILDGNRRWAAAMGYRSAADGHREGAAKIDELLGWCNEVEIGVVTLWLLSTENMDRDPDELSALLEIIVGKVEQIARDGRWRVRAVGAMELLPGDAHIRIQAAVEASRQVEEARAVAANEGGPPDDPRPTLNFAVGYGGRREIVDATKRLLESYADEGLTLADAAKKVTAEEISGRLYTAGLPDPDLIIRTSGETRLSGFLLWQSAHSEYYFCDPYWPDFRRIDFLRAVRAYQQRRRSFGR